MPLVPFMTPTLAYDSYAALVTSFGSPAARRAVRSRQLVLLGNDNGGRDSISVVLVKVLDAFPARRGVVDRILGMFG